MRGLADRIKREPALVTAAVLALINLAAAFGLGITSGQRDAILAVVSAGLSLLGGAVIRSQVTPSTDVVARVSHADVGTDLELVAGPAHPAETRQTPVELPPAL
jgi:hypothetical protein